MNNNDKFNDFEFNEQLKNHLEFINGSYVDGYEQIFRQMGESDSSDSPLREVSEAMSFMRWIVLDILSEKKEKSKLYGLIAFFCLLFGLYRLSTNNLLQFCTKYGLNYQFLYKKIRKVKKMMEDELIRRYYVSS